MDSYYDSSRVESKQTKLANSFRKDKRFKRNMENQTSGLEKKEKAEKKEQEKEEQLAKEREQALYEQELVQRPDPQRLEEQME